MEPTPELDVKPRKGTAEGKGRLPVVIRLGSKKYPPVRHRPARAKARAGLFFSRFCAASLRNRAQWSRGYRLVAGGSRLRQTVRHCVSPSRPASTRARSVRRMRTRRLALCAAPRAATRAARALSPAGVASGICAWMAAGPPRSSSARGTSRVSWGFPASTWRETAARLRQRGGSGSRGKTCRRNTRPNAVNARNPPRWPKPKINRKSAQEP